MSCEAFLDGKVTLHAGDCLDVLAGLPDASVDAIVTDPPYGIRFMGKAWDGADIEAMIERKKRKGTVHCLQEQQNDLPLPHPDRHRGKSFSDAGRICA